MFAYYDPDTDIAWFPTGKSDDVVSERVPGGLHDYDRTSHELIAIEVWDASIRLPASILGALPAPDEAKDRLLHYILDRLRDVYTVEGADTWIHGRNRDLDDEKPIDLLSAGQFERVLAAVERLSAGAM